MRKTNGWVAALALTLAFGAARAGEEENLLVFVGEKISVAQFEPELPPNTLMMDGAFKARFRVVKVIYGRYDGEVIEFDAYDHYGVPPFAAYDHSLLFVSRDGEGFVQQKYQYFPVFRTRDGEWNGCGPTGPRIVEEWRGVVATHPARFAEDAYIPLPHDRPRGRDRQWYARPHFRIEGDRAYCLTGSSLGDLFELKKRTVLKARGLFGGAGAAPAQR
ncbi:hypothetical protein ABIE09_001417 [Lysobacter enzymogenes]|uniref:hypothetical protein n=1 Tax=Lysobacter enzymogenes TaxID=69 RepID=UPI003393BCFF